MYTWKFYFVGVLLQHCDRSSKVFFLLRIDWWGFHSSQKNSFKDHVPVLTKCFYSQPPSTCSSAPTFHFAPGQGVRINSSGSKPWLGYIKHLCESSFSLSSSNPVLMCFFLLFQLASYNFFQHNRSFRTWEATEALRLFSWSSSSARSSFTLRLDSSCHIFIIIQQNKWSTR